MGAKKPSSSRGEALQLLIRMSRPHRRALAYGSLATTGVVAMRLALPWPLRGVVENVFPPTAGGPDPLGARLGGSPVLVFCGLYLLLALGTGLFEWIQRVWMTRAASGTAHDLRALAVSRLGPRASRSDAETADLITRVIGDIARIRADLKGILIHLGQNGLLLLAITVLFLYLAPKLGLLFLLSGVLAIVIGYQAVEEVARTASKHRKKESAYAAAIQKEEDDEEDEPGSLAISESSTRKDVRTTRIIGRSSLLVHGAVAATIGLALWLGVGDVRAGTLAPGELFLFIAYAITIQRRAVMIGRQVARGGKLLANTERLARLIESGAEPSAPPRALEQGIRLEGVRLRRSPSRGNRPRLGPMDLTVSRGEHVLILGGEGAGKSSLLALLAGQLDARRGSVWWDGEDVTARPEVLRASVGFVPEEPQFGRVAVHRLLGLTPERDPAPQERELLEALGAWRVIRRLSDGLDQRISSKELSPGERRLLTLAGVVMGAASVWILDTPIDTERSRDRRRLDTILAQSGERTLVVALGRATEPERFHRIIVLRRGNISFDGTPAEWRAWRGQLREIRRA